MGLSNARVKISMGLSNAIESKLWGTKIEQLKLKGSN